MERLDAMEQRIYEALGAEEMLIALTQALDCDVKEEVYEYISRMYDISPDVVSE